MSTVFIDTSILLFSENGADAAKQATALAWLKVLWQRRMGRISMQVLNEFYLHTTQASDPTMPAGDARAEVRRYALWQPWASSHATLESAWAVESRYGLPYRDCLVIAAAQHLGCTYLLSERMEHEQHYDAVQVINPFLASIDLLEKL